MLTSIPSGDALYWKRPRVGEYTNCLITSIIATCVHTNVSTDRFKSAETCRRWAVSVNWSGAHRSMSRARREAYSLSLLRITPVPHLPCYYSRYPAVATGSVRCLVGCVTVTIIPRHHRAVRFPQSCRVNGRTDPDSADMPGTVAVLDATRPRACGLPPSSGQVWATCSREKTLPNPHTCISWFSAVVHIMEVVLVVLVLF